MNLVLNQNKSSWDAMADTWFGSTALPVYGCLAPTEDELHLFPDLSGKKVLDIGCGSGHSLCWCGQKGAAELWGAGSVGEANLQCTKLSDRKRISSQAV